MRKALIITGDGIGNVIQSTAAISVFRDIFDGVMDLDILIPKPPGISSLIKGTGNLVSKPIRAQEYSYIIPNWIFREYAMKRKGNAIVIPGGDPLKLDTSESDAHVQAILAVARIEGIKHDAIHRMETWCTYGSEECLHLIETMTKPVICLHDGGRANHFWKAKRYPFWQQVHNLVARELPTATFIVLGTKKDGGISGDKEIDLRGRCSLLQTAGILRMADVFMGNDSGLAHISAAQSTSTYIVFGPTNIIKNLPPQNASPITEENDLACRPCQRVGSKWRVGVDGKRCHLECLFTLQPNSVAKRIIAALRKAS
jgi:heptosyltransferase-2